MEKIKLSGNKSNDLFFKLKEFLNRDKNIYFAFIFGSYASKKQKKLSDIDVAIFYKTPPKGIDLLYFANRLSELAGKDVDLIVLNSASSFLRHQIMKYGIPLTIKDRPSYVQFREKTISDYDEYKFISNMGVYDR